MKIIQQRFKRFGRYSMHVLPLSLHLEDDFPAGRIFQFCDLQFVGVKFPALKDEELFFIAKAIIWHHIHWSFIFSTRIDFGSKQFIVLPAYRPSPRF